MWNVPYRLMGQALLADNNVLGGSDNIRRWDLVGKSSLLVVGPVLPCPCPLPLSAFCLL